MPSDIIYIIFNYIVTYYLHILYPIHYHRKNILAFNKARKIINLFIFKQSHIVAGYQLVLIIEKSVYSKILCVLTYFPLRSQEARPTLERALFETVRRTHWRSRSDTHPPKTIARTEGILFKFSTTMTACKLPKN